MYAVWLWVCRRERVLCVGMSVLSICMCICMFVCSVNFLKCPENLHLNQSILKFIPVSTARPLTWIMTFRGITTTGDAALPRMTAFHIVLILNADMIFPPAQILPVLFNFAQQDVFLPVAGSSSTAALVPRRHPLQAAEGEPQRRRRREPTNQNQLLLVLQEQPAELPHRSVPRTRP